MVTKQKRASMTMERTRKTAIALPMSIYIYIRKIGAFLTTHITGLRRAIKGSKMGRP